MKFSEQFALRDLDRNAISSITTEYLFDREHGSGTNKVKVETARMKDDKLYVHYKVEPTYSQEVTAIALNGAEIASHEYDVVFEFQSATESIGDPQTFLSFNIAERASIVRDFFDHGMARVWCSCPAFFYQGSWENMDKLNSAVFPFPGPKGKGIWTARHAKGLMQPGIYICKHIAACIHHIDNDIQTISEILASKLQQNNPS